MRTSQDPRAVGLDGPAGCPPPRALPVTCGRISQRAHHTARGAALRNNIANSASRTCAEGVPRAAQDPAELACRCGPMRSTGWDFTGEYRLFWRVSRLWVARQPFSHEGQACGRLHLGTLSALSRCCSVTMCMLDACPLTGCPQARVGEVLSLLGHHDLSLTYTSQWPPPPGAACRAQPPAPCGPTETSEQSERRAPCPAHRPLRQARPRSR